MTAPIALGRRGQAAIACWLFIEPALLFVVTAEHGHSGRGPAGLPGVT